MDQDKQRVVDVSSYELKERPSIKPHSDGGYKVRTYKGKRPIRQYTSEPPVIDDENEDLSLRGTLFSTLVFVGGAIVLWSGILLTFFLLRF